MMLNFLNFDSKQILSVTMILFAIIDFIGSIPVVIALRQKAGHIQSEKASLVSASLMIYSFIWAINY